MKNIILVFVLIFLGACNSKGSEDQIQEEVNTDPLVGTWYSDAMFFTYNVDTDTARKDTIFLEDFPSKFNMLTVRAVYNDNGSFTSTYIGIDSGIIQKEVGSWYSVADSLYVVYAPTGNLDTFTYHYRLDGEFGIFTSIIDWERDGNANDEIVLVSVREE